MWSVCGGTFVVILWYTCHVCGIYVYHMYGVCHVKYACSRWAASGCMCSVYNENDWFMCLCVELAVCVVSVV